LGSIMEEPTTLVWLPNHDHRTKNSVAYTNGDRYVGELLGEERDGRGTYDYPSARCRYDGEWKKGVRHGHATYYNSKNEKFEGNFRDGKRTKGSKTYHDGTRVFEGLWDNDELIVRINMHALCNTPCVPYVALKFAVVAREPTG
jgi:antitoxin component YwqK of YwqJK toxin-antitoxin module